MSWNNQTKTYVARSEQVSFTSLVYTWMTSGLAVTALIAYYTYAAGWHFRVANYLLLVVLAQFGIVMTIQAGMRSMSYQKLLGMFFAYSGLNGLVFGSVLPLYAMRYGGDIVWVAFASSALIFTIANIYGRVTNSDLTRFEPLLRFGLYALLLMTVGFLIASIFMNVSGFSLIIAYLGLGLFVALSATESQKIRMLSEQVSTDSPEGRKVALFAALGMYINVVTIFWYMLRILSASRE